MGRTKLAIVALTLAFAAATSGSALAAGYGGSAVKLSGQDRGGNLIAPAAYKRGKVSKHRFRSGYRRGYRHRYRRSFRRHRGYGYGYDAFFLSLALPFLLFPQYGHTHDYGYGAHGHYAPPPPEYAPAAKPAAGPAPYCREITMEVVIAGVEQTAHGTACQQADGSWEITDRK